MSGRISLGGESTNPAAYGASTQYSGADLYRLPSASILRSEDPVRITNSAGLLAASIVCFVVGFITLAGVLLNL